MWLPPGVSPIALFLRLLLAGLVYHVGSVYIGVQFFIRYSIQTTRERMFARDLRATFHSEYRDTILPSTISRARDICASNSRSERLCEDGQRLGALILEPMRRNLRENREMLEEIVQAWTVSSADAGTGD